MLQDGQGSTRQLINSSATVTDSYTNDAYGNSIASSGSSTNPMKWNGSGGYYSDAESGLQKVGARYYDPTVGRFISQDSTIVAGSPMDSQALDRYNYCSSSPIGAADPNGHETKTRSELLYEASQENAAANRDFSDATLQRVIACGALSLGCVIIAGALLLMAGAVAAAGATGFLAAIAAAIEVKNALTMLGSGIALVAVGVAALRGYQSAYDAGMTHWRNAYYDEEMAKQAKS